VKTLRLSTAMATLSLPEQVFSNRRASMLAVFGILLIFSLHSYVRMLSTAAYTYMYWSRPKLQFVSEDVAEKAEKFRVPKLIHQTWKDKNVPEKWREAQQSCIDAHPGYTYKLWTDKEGLELIEVCLVI
jgi:mannosyltransferase OCH1-like enzyme